jgi:hypothetical protein
MEKKWKPGGSLNEVYVSTGAPMWSSAGEIHLRIAAKWPHVWKNIKGELSMCSARPARLVTIYSEESAGRLFTSMSHGEWPAKHHEEPRSSLLV